LEFATSSASPAAGELNFVEEGDCDSHLAEAGLADAHCGVEVDGVEFCGVGFGRVGPAAGGGVGGDSTGQSKQVRMDSRQASGPKASTYSLRA